MILDFELKERIEKLEGKTPDEKLKVLWQWAEERTITFSMFKKLLCEIE